jgi:hypothetical protein
VVLQLRVLTYSMLASCTQIKKPYCSYKRSSSPLTKTTGCSEKYWTRELFVKQVCFALFSEYIHVYGYNVCNTD